MNKVMTIQASLIAVLEETLTQKSLLITELKEQVELSRETVEAKDALIELMNKEIKGLN